MSPFGKWRPHVRHLIQLQFVLKMDVVQEGFFGGWGGRGRGKKVESYHAGLKAWARYTANACEGLPSAGGEVPVTTGLARVRGGAGGHRCGWGSAGAVSWLSRGVRRGAGLRAGSGPFHGQGAALSQPFPPPLDGCSADAARWVCSPLLAARAQPGAVAVKWHFLAQPISLF